MLLIHLSGDNRALRFQVTRHVHFSARRDAHRKPDVFFDFLDHIVPSCAPRVRHARHWVANTSKILSGKFSLVL